MEKLYYDLHIHSCLSPCGDDDMTPNNIVNMARLKGLDLIAVTDHNSCANGPAVREAARRSEELWSGGAPDGVPGAAGMAGTAKELLLLYGAEVETEEEVHSLCLFATLEEAQAFERALAPYLGDVKNRPDIYGNQWIMDEYDRVTGEEQRLLAFAAGLSFYDLFRLTEKLGGAFVPAHIDKPVFSVLSNLGFIPEELPIAAAEVSPVGLCRGFSDEHPEISERYKIITSSDAHYLEEIAEPQRFMEVSERTAEAVIRWLKSGKSLK
ncbi:PHP domain-containing protein [Bacilliculturomica massiliensis]|uniref:PHP domain-containing protein n=1 Tax=Bacilliculturomica massiliensis TaxID=1917867 RepID=UPI00102FF12E|nr:PHP domain-containing protein [Bacilliculturomica massiliensis]